MTDAGELPPEVRNLLSQQVRSIEELEALLRVRAEPTRSWSAAEVGTAVGVGADAAREALEELAANGLIAASNASPLTFHYAPREPKLAAVVDLLAEAYATHRVEVLVLISKSAMSRVRRGALRTFSEAFRLRGPKKDG